MGALNDTVLLPVDALAFLLQNGGRGGREKERARKELDKSEDT